MTSSSSLPSSSSDFLVKTIVIAGIECGVYGLDELKGDKVAVIVSSTFQSTPFSFSPRSDFSFLPSQFVAHGRNDDRTSMTKYCQWLLKSVASKAKAAGGKQEKELVVINIVSLARFFPSRTSLFPPSLTRGIHFPGSTESWIEICTSNCQYGLCSERIKLRFRQQLACVSPRAQLPLPSSASSSSSPSPLPFVPPVWICTRCRVGTHILLLSRHLS